MEFEFNSNDGAPILARGEGPEVGTPSCGGPGDGDGLAPPPSADAGLEVEASYSDDFFDYPAEITQRISQVSEELLRLRDALVVERECLAQETEEVAALKTLDAQVHAQVHAQAQTQAQTQKNKQVQAQMRQFEYEDTASLYEPQDIVYIQAEKRRQAQELIQKERYMKQMMEVEKMCSEEFFHLNKTRAKVDQLNREVSDWRLAHGKSTGFNLYPMEIMRSSEPPCPVGGGPGASIPGRFTVNQMMTSAGIRSVPNVTLPVPDISSLSSSSSSGPDQPWVQTFAGAMRPQGKGPKEGTWRGGDAEERMLPIVHF